MAYSRNSVQQADISMPEIITDIAACSSANSFDVVPKKCPVCFTDTCSSEIIFYSKKDKRCYSCFPTVIISKLRVTWRIQHHKESSNLHVTLLP